MPTGNRYAILVRLGNVAGQASTLGQLGNLYDDVLGRPEEAVAFYRQATDKYVEIGDEASEGRTRNNLGHTLRKLRRFDEARQEMRRAIECKEPFGHAAEPWTSWATLAAIETNTGNAAAAAEAKQRAIECFLAYRRDGGENHSVVGQVCLAVTMALLAGEPATAASLLKNVSTRSDSTAATQEFLQILQSIGSPTGVARAQRESFYGIITDQRDIVYSAAQKFDFDNVAKSLPEVSTVAHVSRLGDERETKEVPGYATFIQAVRAIVAGSRDRTLADAPDLDYTMAAEILFLLDNLEKAGK